MKSNRILCIAAAFGNTWNFNTWRSDMFCYGKSYSIRELKMKFNGVLNIRYSKRMLIIPSAVSIHLIKIEQLRLKWFEVIKSHLPAFNYAVPEPDR